MYIVKNVFLLSTAVLLLAIIGCLTSPEQSKKNYEQGVAAFALKDYSIAEKLLYSVNKDDQSYKDAQQIKPNFRFSNK